MVSVLPPYFEICSICDGASSTVHEHFTSVGRYLRSFHRSLRMPVKKTYAERYINLVRLQDLLWTLFADDFKIRVSGSGVKQDWACDLHANTTSRADEGRSRYYHHPKNFDDCRLCIKVLFVDAALMLYMLQTELRTVSQPAAL